MKILRLGVETIRLIIELASQAVDRVLAFLVCLLFTSSVIFFRFLDYTLTRYD